MAQGYGSYNQFGQYGQVPGQPQQQGRFPSFGGGHQGGQYPQGTFPQQPQQPASGTNTSDLSSTPPTGDSSAPAAPPSAQQTTSTPAPPPVTSGAAGQQPPAEHAPEQYPLGTFQNSPSNNGGLSQSSTGPTNMVMGQYGAPGAWDGGYNPHAAPPPVPAQAPMQQPPSAGSYAPQQQAPTAPPGAPAPAAPAAPLMPGGSVTKTSAGLQPTPGTVTPGGPGWSVSLPTLNPSWFASQKDANQATADQNALGSQLGGYGYAVSGGNQAAPTTYPAGTFPGAPLQSTPVAPVFSMPTDPAARNQRYNEMLNQGFTDAQIANNPYFLYGTR